MRPLRLSDSVRALGYTALPLPEGEWLKLLEITRSGQTEGTGRRVNLPPVILSCALCRQTYTRPAYEHRKWIAKGNADHYCSLLCSRAHHAVKNHRLCRACGKPTPRKTMGYCPECRPVRRGRAVTYPPVSKTCPTCNTPMTAVWRGKRQGYQVYCSRRCADIGHSARMSARGNPKWKHGATPLRQQPHSAKAFRIMRPLVLERDKWVCVACGSEKRPHVHHIDNWPMNNASGNLVTLCATCHQKLHRALDFKPDTNPLPWLSEYAKRPLFTTSK